MLVLECRLDRGISLPDTSCFPTHSYTSSLTHILHYTLSTVNHRIPQVSQLRT